jgi:hypothetical protein
MPDAPDPIARNPAAARAIPLELAYAPPAKSSHRPIWVLICGVLTSLIALAAVYFIDRSTHSSLMGWYIDYFLPVGALGVGLVASSGYGIASWRMGVKIRRGLLWAMLGLLIGCYFTAEYVEFRMRGPISIVRRMPATGSAPGKPPIVRQLGFWEYFHRTAVNWTWTSDSTHPNEKHEPLGMWGYVFRIAGILGFVAGGAIVPVVLMKKDYCELCERYMKTRTLAVFPASIPFKKFKKSDTEATAKYGQQQQQMLQNAQARHDRMAAAAATGDLATFRDEILKNTPEKKAAAKLPRRVLVSLIRCPNCSNGYLGATMKSGQGNQVKVVQVSKKELSPEFVRAFEASAAS